MKYVCLGYIEPGRFDGMTAEEQDALLDECFAYNAQLRATGHVLAEVPLQPPENALTLCLKTGAVATTDGPHGENREQLGGLHILEARDLEHAVQLIARHPGMRYGSIELRPVADLSAIRRESDERRRNPPERRKGCLQG
jgi:hypothetical protein